MEKLQNFPKMFYSFFSLSLKCLIAKWYHSYKINGSRTKPALLSVAKTHNISWSHGWETQSSLQGNAIYIWIFTNTIPCLRSPVPPGNISTVTPKDPLLPWEGQGRNENVSRKGHVKEAQTDQLKHHWDFSQHHPLSDSKKYPQRHTP